MGYRVVQNGPDGFKNLGKGADFILLASAREYACNASQKFPGVGVIVIDSSDRAVFDTVCPQNRTQGAETGTTARKGKKR
jgi:hypothetical protein